MIARVHGKLDRSNGSVGPLCACGGFAGHESECAACRAERLQRQAGTPRIVHDVLRSPDRSLEPGVRAHMQARRGHDFSRVRVHTDARAAESAHGLSAGAHSVGNDIVFQDHGYQLSTEKGRRLLVHELTHVVQPGGPPAGMLAAVGAAASTQMALYDAQTASGRYPTRQAKGEQAIRDGLPAVKLTPPPATPTRPRRRP